MPPVPIASSSDLPEHGALRFQVVLGGQQVQAFALRFAGQVRAYVNVCTHRAMELDLGEGAFFSDDGRFLACRAHGALYDPLDGTCSGGICARGSALTPVRVAELGGTIYALLD